MLDFGFLTLPTLAALTVMISALFIGEDIVIERMHVSHQLEWSGYKSEVVTRQLTDEIRELTQAAQSELAALNVDEGALEKGITALEDYFEVGQLINGVRNMMGLIPYYINGEVTEKRGEARLTVRVTNQEQERVKLIRVAGPIEEMHRLMHDAAHQVLEYINPYVVTLHHRRAEMAAGDFDFPKTRRAIDNYLKNRPVEEHYLAYGLAGRMYMLKAELDKSLSEEARLETYREAKRNLHAALRQEPDFLFPLINLALINRDLGNYALAEKYFRRAVELNPNYLITRRAWGEMLRDQGRHLDSIRQYVAAVEINPKDPKLRQELGGLYQQVGLIKEAREQIDLALRLSPYDPELLTMLATIGTDGDCTPLDPDNCDTLQ